MWNSPPLSTMVRQKVEGGNKAEKEKKRATFP
jgi:hypothetical protein